MKLQLTAFFLFFITSSFSSTEYPEFEELVEQEVIAHEAEAVFLEVATSLSEECSCYFINAQQIPLVIEPNSSVVPKTDWLAQNKEQLHELMHTYGAVLLRRFPAETAQDFVALTSTVFTDYSAVDYTGGDAIRTKVDTALYTASDAPSRVLIPLHNELSCTRYAPKYICFYCETPSQAGTGQTILAKTAEVTAHLMDQPEVWQQFENRKLCYITNHPTEGNFFTKINPTHQSWQRIFRTDSREEVERICLEKGFDFHWNGDWIKVSRLLPAIREADEFFPFPYWFNQAHLFHANPRLYGGQLVYWLAKAIYADPATRQYDITFEDGSEIPRETIYTIYDALNACTARFDWQKGDVLLVDNIRTLHGRTAFAGQRRILVTMYD